jgi:hypothetical protein
LRFAWSSAWYGGCGKPKVCRATHICARATTRKSRLD